MSMHEYVVRQQDGLWGVWLGDRLVSGYSTQMEALHVAEALAGAAAPRGEAAKILDVERIELLGRAPGRPAAEST